MDKLALALQIMQGANLVTPAIANIFAIVRKGREDGKSDEEIQAESMATIDRVISKAEQQMGNQA
jgi:hypothetical protein